MAREILQGQPKDVGMMLKTVPDPEAGGVMTGNHITLETVPPTEIVVFPNRVEINQPGASNTHILRGRSKLLMHQMGLTVETIHDDDSLSQVVFDRRGRMVITHEPDKSIVEQTPDELFLSRRLTKDDADIRLRRLQEQINFNDPTTYEDVSFSDLLFYLRMERKLSQLEVAKGSMVSPAVYSRYENVGDKGRFPSIQIFRAIKQYYNWEKNDPQLVAIEHIYNKESELRKEKARSRRAKTRRSRTH